MIENNIVIEKEINSQHYIQFKKLLDLNIKHGFSMKGMNFNFKIAKKEDIDNDLDKLSNDLEINRNRICRAIQNHTSNVIKVENDIGINIPEFTDIDALITNKKDTPLAVTTADCIPIIIYDPVNNAIGCVHSGWKGTLNVIVINTVDLMKKEYNSDIEKLLFFFGPSICKNCFETKEDVKTMFENKFSYICNSDEYIVKKDEEHYLIDTILINKKLLLNKGAKEENLYFSNICTLENKDNIHSYRASDKNNYKLGITIVSL